MTTQSRPISPSQRKQGLIMFLIMAGWRGGPDIALDVWGTREQEGLNGDRAPCTL
jgi:hypothetical protein